MRTISLTIFSLLICSIGWSQVPVVDTHPSSQIFAVNYESGEEVQAAGDQAILFKDAFIDLVSATPQSRQILRATPGRKTAIIKQIDPKKLNGYQLTWQSTYTGQTSVLCTFYYNIDESALYFYDQDAANWVNVPVGPTNLNNLHNCQAYAKFNQPRQALPDLSVNGNNAQQAPDLSVNGNTNDTPEAEMQTGLDSLSDEELSSGVEPPEMPEYEQPHCPVDGYQWQPGYWSYNMAVHDYYWVPGVWVAPPRPGVLWTPGYWEFGGGAYRFHHGYWGTTVGFYGGINYGFGYWGVGFVGGEWHAGVFRYNTAVVHVNTVVVHNTYINNTVVRNTTVINRTSFNGRGGVVARPMPQEEAAMHQEHFRATNEQLMHQRAAVSNKGQFASVNSGRPAMASMERVNTATLNPHRNNPPAFNGNKAPNNQPATNTYNQHNNMGQHGQNRQQKHQHQPNQPKHDKSKN